MAMKCTRCGTLLVPGSVSCPGCGLQFATPVPQDPAAPQAAPPAQPQYGAPPPYGAPPQPGPAPQYGTPPPQYGTPSPYGAPQPYGTPYGQQAPKKAVPVWAWVVGAVVLLGILAKVGHIGESSPAPKAPVTTPGTPAPAVPTTPPAAPTAPPATGDGDVDALASNMTKFGEALQEFGVINGKPQFDDPVWQKKMEQNIQEIKDDIAAEKQINWPAKFLPAKANYEGGLAEYQYLADHWVAAVEHTDTAALKDCENHAQHGNDLLTAAEKQIKEISGAS